MSLHNLKPKQYAQQILRLSEHMRDMSYKQDWTACIKLEEQRQTVMTALFEHDEITQALADIAEILEEVLYIDSESLYMCDEARVKEVKSLKDSKSRRKAVVAYHSHLQ